MGDRETPNGSAYVVWMDGPDKAVLERHPGSRGTFPPPQYECHYEPSAEELPIDGPDTDSLDEALEWARGSADEVLVRPQWDPRHFYIADAGPPRQWRMLPD